MLLRQSPLSYFKSIFHRRAMQRAAEISTRSEAIAAVTRVVGSNEGFKAKVAAASADTRALLASFLENLQHAHPQDVKPPTKMIVVEGLDGTGKSTVTTALCQHPCCIALLRTPPPEYAPLRAIFDTCEESDRRAFYFAANYVASDIAAKKMMDPAAKHNGFVLFDRYYYSTIAYGLAHKHTMETLPPRGSAIYKWPADLFPHPTEIVLLVASEETRVQRIRERAATEMVVITEEEERLRKSQEFRQLVTEAYRRCEGVVEVSADGSPEQVLGAVQREIGVE